MLIVGEKLHRFLCENNSSTDPEELMFKSDIISIWFRPNDDVEVHGANTVIYVNANDDYDFLVLKKGEEGWLLDDNPHTLAFMEATLKKLAFRRWFTLEGILNKLFAKRKFVNSNA